MPAFEPLRPIPFPVLVGDIGGTNARFAIVPEGSAGLVAFPSVETEDFPDIETAIERTVLARSTLRPRSALIDIAGPVDGDEMDLTNARWRIRPRVIIERLGLDAMVVFNDFEALAMALGSLNGNDLVEIGGPHAPAGGARAVLGPGTGLGVGALLDAAGVAVPVPGEGGHVALGPVEDDEFALWPHIEKEHGRISAEAILCGRGLVRLYRAVAAQAGLNPRFGEPAEVTEAALSDSDPLAVRTLLLWCRLLGRVAGDMALVVMARGGTYVGGGIPPRILSFLQRSEFRAAFEAKAPHEHVMKAMPTYVIVGENPALTGLAAFARNPSSFGVNLDGRFWTK